jgi:hypothetical protein
MEPSDQLTTHAMWQRFMSCVILTTLIIGSVLVFNQLRSHGSSSRTLWPMSDVVTLTGYGQISPMYPSSDPTSVVLTRSQALALDQEMTALQLGGFPDCHENSVVFTLAIAPRRTDVPDWTVKEWECPAPGTLYVESAIGIQTYRGPVCPVNALVIRDLPRGSSSGTRSAFKLCSDAQQAPIPIVRVTPLRRLHNGEMVTVSVKGFRPQSKFWISECAKAADANGRPGCGVQLATEPFGIANDAGTGAETFIVHSRASAKPYSTNKSVACRNQCVLMVTSGVSEYAYSPIQFAVLPR